MAAVLVTVVVVVGRAAPNRRPTVQNRTPGTITWNSPPAPLCLPPSSNNIVMQWRSWGGQSTAVANNKRCACRWNLPPPRGTREREEYYRRTAIGNDNERKGWGAGGEASQATQQASLCCVSLHVTHTRERERVREQARSTQKLWVMHADAAHGTTKAARWRGRQEDIDRRR